MEVITPTPAATTLPPPPAQSAPAAAPLISASTTMPQTAPATQPPVALPAQPYYAFITHSSACLRDNQPPIIDNAGLARRRRRRTSQHDQAILEEEYRRCDRPDKARRREIAKRVEMGDKEVQIWFQNKRQSARRKLKPLLPHEVIPSGGAKSGCSSSPTAAPRGQGRSSSVGPRRGGGGGAESSGNGGFMRSSSSYLGEGELEEKKFDSSQNHGYYSQVEHDTPSRKVTKRKGEHASGLMMARNEEEDGLDGAETDEDVDVNDMRRRDHEAVDEGDGRGGVDDEEDEEVSLPPVASEFREIRRRMSTSHMRLQEALEGSGVTPSGTTSTRPGTAAGKKASSQATSVTAAAAASGPQARDDLLPPPSQSRSAQQQHQGKHRTSSFTSHFPRDPPSELSEYIFSDPAPQHTPLRKPSSNPANSFIFSSDKKKPVAIGSILAPPRPPPSTSSSQPPPQQQQQQPTQQQAPKTYVHPRRQPPNPSGTINPPPPLLKRSSSSFLRLSTSLEGKAEVVYESEPTLPPPLLTPRKSHNVSGGYPDSSSALRGRGGSSMKSSRVWEFHCDNPPPPSQHHGPALQGKKYPHVSAFEDSSDSEASLLEAEKGGHLGLGATGRDFGSDGLDHDDYDDDASAALTLARSRSRRRSIVDTMGGSARRLLFEDHHHQSQGQGAAVQNNFHQSQFHQHRFMQFPPAAAARRKVLTPQGHVGKTKRKSGGSGGGAVLGEITNANGGGNAGGAGRKVKKAGLQLQGGDMKGGLGMKGTTGSGKKRVHSSNFHGAAPIQSPAVKKKGLGISGGVVGKSVGEGGEHRAGGGGEDYYIQGGESDKENHAVSGGGKHHLGGEEHHAHTESAVKKRKVLGGGNGSRGGSVAGKAVGEKQMQVDEEGAELLLSLSAGSWGV